MRILIIMMLMSVSLAGFAQSKTTQALYDGHKEALTVFFYHNTLRMLNQKEDKEFDALIKDIEKMRFLMIDKTTDKFQPKDYAALTKGYKSESYEEIMTSRHQGRNFDVYLKEQNNKVKGTVVLVNDSTYLYILDILGSVAMDRVTSLFNMIDESADIGAKIKDFTSHGDKKRNKIQVETDDN